MDIQKQMLTPREASRILGVSYPTIKKWISSGRLKTFKTPRGHNRVAYGDLKPFVEQNAARKWSGFGSGRNQLAGKVVSVRIERSLAEVILAIGDVQITAIITEKDVHELGLRKGDMVIAHINSSDVIVERLDDELS